MSTKVSTDLIDLSSNTGGLIWAKGTTAQQPASATAGEMRVDTTTATTLVYNGTQWKTLKETAFVAPPVPTHFLVVAGGGGGSRYGGGGAGGLRTSYGSLSGGGVSAESTTGISLNTPYTITVGTGGAGGNRAAGSEGSNSIFSNLTSIGGGQGKSGYSPNIINGGSGGGGKSDLAGGTGTSGQGYNGGPGGLNGPADYKGTGGGGASQAGQTYNGGNGLAVSITGSSVTYAGGGGGSFYQGSSGAAGGSGGGGNGTGWQGGASPEIANGNDGVFNTGGGAGGGMNGGPGVVILRYPTADLPYFTTTGTLNTPSATDTVADVAYPVTNLAYYKLDNNANDSGLGSGYIGQGGIFNGTSSVISLPTGVDKNNNFTLSFWVNFDTLSDYDSLITLQLNYRIYTNAMSDGRLFFYDGNTTLSTSAGAVAIGNWYNIVVTKSSTLVNGKGMIIYVNGVDVANNSVTANAINNTSTGLNLLGAYNASPGGNYFYLDGRLDQVRIFNTALSSSNVALLSAETSATSSTLNYPTGTGGQALYEFSGNANSTSSSAYDGTATNVKYAYNGTATDVTYGNGRFNEAANFNGTSSVISLGTSSPLNTFGGAQTISVWVKPSSADRESIIGYRQEASPYQWNQIEKMSNNTLRFLLGNYSDSSQFVFTSVGTITSNQWNHIAITVDSTSAKIYINNGTPETQTGTPTSYSNSEPTFIGGDGTTDTDYFTGQIDQVRIFSSALAAGDVEDLYNEHFPTKFTDGSDTALKFTGGTGTIKFLDTEPITVNYLIVAGGGGGGPNHGGGGGAGGLRTSYGSTSGGGGAAESSLTLSIGTIYTVTIGAGGIGGVVSSNGASGANSVFSTITSLGGGGGAQNSGAGVVGGSGGGGSRGGGASSGTAGQGYGGATGSSLAGGGGGGAGVAGSNGGSSSLGGDGGNGSTNSISGTSTPYAGGGGGNGYSANGGTGGTGGGGNGGKYGGSDYIGTDGTPNTGGGGGGNFSSSGGFQQRGMDGGSGVVILRYPSAYTATYTAGTGGAADAESTVGSDNFIRITAGTGTITFS